MFYLQLPQNSFSDRAISRSAYRADTHLTQPLIFGFLTHIGDQSPTGVNLSVMINERLSSLTCYLRIYVSSFPSIQVHH
jgi:hypothetical protein